MKANYVLEKWTVRTSFGGWPDKCEILGEVSGYPVLLKSTPLKVYLKGSVIEHEGMYYILGNPA